ncbi:hypothetical protein AAFF_G00271240 [Aldrovandia affinis]|uniref:Gasdermin pore forming domain-containing protein n=1 Tax=Aldrovandia affinis TaxID=143900 RepID=A0AAD7W2R0_9TELE|nr:hypothetical protein AAFF_G00271240 [Aldrovandia affinis]
MFKSVIKRLVKDLDESDLIPVTGPLQASEVDVLCIMKIVKSSKMQFFKEVCYHPTGIKLQELLKSEDTMDFGLSAQKTMGTVKMNREEQAAVGVQYNEPFMGKSEIKAAKIMINGASKIELEIVSKNCNTIEEMLQKSTVNEKHHVIREMENSKQVIGLAVIYKVVKAKNQVTLERTNMGGGRMELSVLERAKMFASGRVTEKKEYTLEAGWVLGFKCSDVPYSNQPWGLVTDGEAEFAEEVAGDFPTMKQQVEADLRCFTEMARGVKRLIWDPLSRILTCPQALYALNSMLDDGCLCTDSPSPLDKVPEDLRQSFQCLLQVVGLDRVEEFDCFNLLKPLGLLVGVLADLGEETVTLIMGLGSGEVRGQVLNLVEAALELVYSGDGGDPQWSEQFSRNTMTVEILMSCGLDLDDLGSPGNPDEALLALYIALQGIHMLSPR